MELNMCQIGAILELCDKKCCIIILEDKYTDEYIYLMLFDII